MPFSLVLMVPGTSQVVQQDIKLDVSYFSGFFPDVLKWILADQA